MCLSVFSAGYLVPGWQYLAIGWEFLNVVDFPFSVVAIWLSWRHHEALALASYFIVGPLWWFYLGRKADLFLEHRYSKPD
jgi:hypothetical protein